MFHLYFIYFLFSFSTCMVIPDLVDVTMFALCPGESQCSVVILLTGVSQAVIGIGSFVVMPLIGNLSDVYGRKALLTLPLVLNIIPLAILAYGRSRDFVYAYLVISTFTSMVCGGSVHCLSLAYVADTVPEDRRASAFGILSGIGSCAFVCANLSARILSVSSTFQVAASLAIVALVYTRVLLPESIIDECDDLPAPLLPNRKSDAVRFKRVQIFKTTPSIEDMLSLLKTSLTFLQVAVVSFFSNLADMAFFASLMYYLKAKFHFDKDQFADLMGISGVAGTFSQLVLVPIFVPALGEERLLSIGLLFSCAHMILYSIAWSTWVPYVAAMFPVMFSFVQPCIRSIVSKQVGPHEQGKAQGIISGISSIANLVAPLVFSPLTALFLSDKAPFDFPGFSIMCIGFAAMIALLQSLMIRVAPPLSNSNIGNVLA